MKNAGILDVFQVFQTAVLGQKIRRSPQTQLRGVVLGKGERPAVHLLLLRFVKTGLDIEHVTINCPSHSAAPMASHTAASSGAARLLRSSPMKPMEPFSTAWGRPPICSSRCRRRRGCSIRGRCCCLRRRSCQCPIPVRPRTECIPAFRSSMRR